MGIVGWITTISSVLASIVYLVKLFKGSSQSKIEEGMKDNKQENDEFKKTGRPPK